MKYYHHSLITTPKIHTDLLWDLTLLFVGLSVLYFIGIFFYRNKLSFNSAKIAQRKKVLSPMLSEFLFFEDESSKNEKKAFVALKIEIRELLKDQFNRKVLSGMLLDLQQDVSGETRKRVFALYKDLGLHQDAYVKLKSWRWEVVSQGILELTQMQISESYEFVTKFVNDRRGAIRKQAEIAVVTLKHEGINYFLDTTNHSISEWQQLKLLDVLRNLEGFFPPKFKAWLTSTNKYVVLFSLRLIKYYNQNDAYASIIELIKHKDAQIQAEAVSCIKEFHVLDAREILRTVFWNAKTDNKLLILDALAQFGVIEDLDFLKLIQNKEVNYSVKSKALSVINVISPGSIMPTEGIMTLQNKQIPEDIELKTRVNIVLNEDAEETQDDFTYVETEKGESVSTDFEEITEDVIHDFEDAQGILSINFIPIVVENDCEEKKNKDNITPNDSENIEHTLKGKIAGGDLLNFDFLPIICENEVDEKKSVEASKAIILQSDNHQHVTSDATGESPLMPEYDEEPKELKEEIPFQVPAPCFDTTLPVDTLLKTFIDPDFGHLDFLDAIEELGDQREIPLLQEMLSKMEKGSDKERISILLEKLTGRQIRIKSKHTLSTFSTSPETELYSIFEDLFRNSDTESKLILLEEVAAVGDEKELYFLSKLLNDPDTKIRGLAKREYEKLSQQLSLVSDQTSKVTQEVTIGAVSKTVNNKMVIDDEKNHSGEIEKIIPKSSPSRRSMEFCFLLDELEIKPAKTKTIFDIDFELTQTISSTIDIHEEIESLEPAIESINKKSFFEDLVRHLMEYQDLIKEKFHG